jgi:hypothetical protein
MKCLNCFKTSAFLEKIEKLSKKSFLSKNAFLKLKKTFSQKQVLYPKLDLCPLYAKKLSLPKSVSYRLYQKHLRKEAAFYLVFVNGHLQKEFLSSGLKMSSVTIEMQKKLLHQNGLGLVNLALSQKPLCLTIPEGFSCKAPLQVLHLVTEKKAAFMAPVLFVQIGENARINVLQEVVDLSKSEEPLFAPTLFFEAGENAKVSFTHLNLESYFWHNVF